MLNSRTFSDNNELFRKVAVNPNFSYRTKLNLRIPNNEAIIATIRLVEYLDGYVAVCSKSKVRTQSECGKFNSFFRQARGNLSEFVSCQTNSLQILFFDLRKLNTFVWEKSWIHVCVRALVTESNSVTLMDYCLHEERQNFQINFLHSSTRSN